MTYAKTTKARIKKASESCENADQVLRILYPDVFKVEEEKEGLGHTIDQEFKDEVHELCEQLEKVIYATKGDKWEERKERGYYIMAKIAYAHMPSPEDEDVRKVEERYTERYNID